jgi:hypothetical protein
MIGSQGDSHIAIGVGIQATQSGSSCNVVIGNRIGGGNFQGSSLNVIVGQYAACDCLSGSNKNVILGANAGTTLNLACNNVAIGYGVAPPTSSSDCTLAIGYDTGCHWLTGDCTKAIKPGAGIIDCANSCGTAGQVLISTGSNGICWGPVSGGSAATPTVAGTVLGCTNATNAALGCNTTFNLTTGTSNVALGTNTLYNLTSGSSNVALGDSAGLNLTTGSNNVAIGPSVQVPSSTGSCQLAMGYMNGCCWLTGDSNKNLYSYNGFVIKGVSAIGTGPVGTATNDTYFYQDQTYGAVLTLGNTFGSGKSYLQFRNTTNAIIGYVAANTNTSVLYVTSSDHRLKENVKDLEGATEIVRALPVREFNFISEPEVTHQGFLAHELQEFVPQAVTGKKDEVDAEGNAKYQGVDASQVVPLLVAALKESIARIDALEAEVKDLKSNS